ncbi:SDR family NAD(P)-dependent oxidoreductase [Pelosinus sp. UFO1]|uniref:SDR family NAD(P)-dependent oxidoreductase n=1 Tax=Pelosinus sp. UFO1 TaxID=484770 RepID=UPI0004D15DF4|nr:SDR family NAD(P)-dependent oxidoreductase [Pelosinus sp. UFO1]AIF53271.1 3-oxoacyl-(acyl-carrier-protein) reductase [Pelosinus sp. UFO1]
MLLEKKVAIVTGATRGIGKSIALTLAKQGASLVINGNNEDLLNELASEIEKLGKRCLVEVGDISDPVIATKIVKTAIDHFGNIDILVNNAGINMRTPTLEMKLDDWQKVINVNLNGTLYCCMAVLPFMIQQKYGKIVNVSSSTAKTPHRNASPSYGASKAGVNYLTQHLALEMAKHNIYVNGVCPGPIETDMSTQWTDEYRQQVLSRIPLGKLGQSQNVADAVLFLASSMSDFITGETININGGTYMN